MGSGSCSDAQHGGGSVGWMLLLNCCRDVGMILDHQITRASVLIVAMMREDWQSECGYERCSN